MQDPQEIAQGYLSAPAGVVAISKSAARPVLEECAKLFYFAGRPRQQDLETVDNCQFAEAALASSG